MKPIVESPKKEKLAEGKIHRLQRIKKYNSWVPGGFRIFGLPFGVPVDLCALLRSFWVPQNQT